MSSVHAQSSLVRLSYFTERGGFLELRVICEKLMVYRMACNDVREMCGVQNEENGPQHRALRHTIPEL